MASAARNNNRFSSFVMGIVTSKAFQMSQTESVETTTDQSKNAVSR
jgi:hypothetical protein